MTTITDPRYDLNLFYSGEKSIPEYLNVQNISADIYSATALCIVAFAMDFPQGTSVKARKELEKKWLNLLPTLDNIKSLSIRLRVNQDFFDAVCKMKNLERLHFWTSTADDISAISKLKNLTRLDLERFSGLTDISPLLELPKLKLLSIENSHKIANYDIIGNIHQLIGLKLCGDSFAPKNLRLPSLKPYRELKNLEHLDLNICSVIDGSYEEIINLTSLKRFDTTTSRIPKHAKELISAHKTLIAGFWH